MLPEKLREVKLGGFFTGQINKTQSFALDIND